MTAQVLPKGSRRNTSASSSLGRGSSGRWRSEGTRRFLTRGASWSSRSSPACTSRRCPS